MHRLEELKIWQRSIGLTKMVYEKTRSFPDEERFGLISQSRRSAVSIASNIGEGAGRDSDKEFAHFLAISVGSSYELLTQLRIASELKYLKRKAFETLTDEITEIQKMIRAFKSNLNV